jgi:hypothetical protein
VRLNFVATAQHNWLERLAPELHTLLTTKKTVVATNVRNILYIYIYITNVCLVLVRLCYDYYDYYIIGESTWI